MLDLSDGVKLRTSKREWIAKESTGDGEFLGWDTRLKDESFVNNTIRELLEDFEELLNEELLSKKELSEGKHSPVEELGSHSLIILNWSQCRQLEIWYEKIYKNKLKYFVSI